MANLIIFNSCIHNKLAADKLAEHPGDQAGKKSCNLQSKSDPEERSLGFALLKGWGILRGFRQIAHDDLRAIFP